MGEGLAGADFGWVSKVWPASLAWIIEGLELFAALLLYVPWLGASYFENWLLELI